METAILGYAFCSIAAIFISAWIFSIVFRVSRKRELMEAQLELLARIAKQQGVPKDDIRDIMKRIDRDTYFIDKP